MSTRSRKRAEKIKAHQLSSFAVKELLDSIVEISQIQQALAVAKAHQDSLLRAYGLDPTKQYRVESTGRVVEVPPAPQQE
jgi:hypothetical protein